jgi:hypothetical protein
VMALEKTLGVTAGHNEMMDFVNTRIDESERDLPNRAAARRSNQRVARS